jgi:hypothetical protein
MNTVVAAQPVADRQLSRSSRHGVGEIHHIEEAAIQPSLMALPTS